MSIRTAILTVSDRASRGERPDTSGPVLVDLITKQGWVVVETAVVPDERLDIERTLTGWCDRKQSGGRLDLILTTGGTGFAPRDVTPEATIAVIQRIAPGIAEAMRMESLKITPHAMLSRSVAGIRGRTLIVNLPGSPKAAVENFKVVLPVIPHAIELLREKKIAEEGHSFRGNAQ